MRTGPALFALFVVAGLFSVHRPATAAITTQQGTLCRPYGFNYSGSYVSTGLDLTNVSNVAGEVLCPVIRTQEVGASGYFKLYVDGTVAAGASTTCWLISDDYAGNLIGITAATINGPATFDQLLVLPQSQVPMWSSQVVDCVLPAGGAILDIEPLYD